MQVWALSFNTAADSTCPQSCSEALSDILFCNSSALLSPPDVFIVSLQEVNVSSGLLSSTLPPPNIHAKLKNLIRTRYFDFFLLHFMLDITVYAVTGFERLVSLLLNSFGCGYFAKDILQQLLTPITHSKQKSCEYAHRWNGKVARLFSKLSIDSPVYFQHISHGSNMLLVWSFRQGVTITNSDVVGCGFLGLLANKGAVYAQISDGHGFSFDVISMHLSAHEGENRYMKRCDNFRDILQRLDFGDLSLFQLVLGDLNFRLAVGKKEFYDRFGNRKIIELSELFQYDELQRALKHDPVISNNFEEPLRASRFPCTYKLYPSGVRYRKADLINLDAYNWHKRLPAWCDRVLISKASHCNVSLTAYQTSLIETRSDHMPVLSKITTSLTDTYSPSEQKPLPGIRKDYFRIEKQLVGFLLNYTIVQVMRWFLFIGVPVLSVLKLVKIIRQ